MDTTRPRAVATLLGILALAFAVDAFAQGGTGSVTGAVYDNVGVVPGATVTATMPATGTVRTTTTNEAGIFRFAALAPGRYTVKVEITGFKPLTVEEFALLGADSRDLGKLVMQAGGITEALAASQPAVIGNLGSDEYLDYTLVGTTVNLAARLCGLSGQSIVVSKAVRDAVGGDREFAFSDGRDVDVRGFKEPITVYDLQRPPA